MLNYLILVFWEPITSTIRDMFLVEVRDRSYDIKQIMDQSVQRITRLIWIEVAALYPRDVISSLISWSRIVDLNALVFTALSPSIFRFVLSIIFVGSFLLRPLVMRPISLVWARIVESDKPIFTVIFGGAAAFASAISEVAKHLHG
jgi:hypothetical protein